MVGQHLVKYRLLEEVGQGGMAKVYRGLDTNLNREVAIKILHPHLAEEEEARQRFHREANAVAKLHHENIIEIYDYSGIDSDATYLVTEFIHGQTLREFLSRHPISHPELAAMVVVEVCCALEHAHGLGVIHRDIKPENIMIRTDGLVKLTDFGIAQVVDVQRLTITGQLLGSPAYMAPELVEGKRIDCRSDIFSVGTLLYQLATSEMPFKGRNPHELLKRISEGRFLDPEVANPVVGSKLARIIRRALAHDPEARHQEIRALKEDLLDFLADVQITDVKKELKDYFTTPAEYSRKLQEQVVATLSERGKTELENRRTPQALEFFNRVLCVDPVNREVLDILDQITRRRRAGRAVAVILLVAGLTAGAYVLATTWPDYRGEGTALPLDGGRPGRSLDGAAQDGLALSDSLRLSPGESGAASRRDARPADRARVPLMQVRLQPPRRVEISLTPKSGTIWLNGKLLGSYGPDLRHVMLPAGARSTLKFINDACCYEKTVTVEPHQRIEELRVRLAWKPARLLVQVRPEVPADVLVEGTLVAYRAGQSIPVEIPSFSDDGRVDKDVKISADGFRSEARRVKLRCNTSTTLTVPLRRVD